MRKILFIICDGLGDRPSAELNGLTPLQAAKKPNIDRIAANAMQGVIYTISPGTVPGSDTSHLTLLGYNPEKVYTGRGPLEAVGAGVEMKAGDVAFRCNFATVDERGVVKDRRAGRIKEPETAELASLLQGIEIGEHRLTFKESTEHRCVLVIHGSGLGANVTDTDPGVEGKAILQAEGKDTSSQQTAEILNKFMSMVRTRFENADVNKKRVAKGLPPANAVLARGAGVFPEIEQFKEKTGMRMAAIAAEGLIVGICKVLGAKVYSPPGYTAGMDSNLENVASTAEKLLRENDMVFIHVKPTDVAGHDGNPIGKKEVIEKVDRMIGDMSNFIENDIVLAMTGDHSTPASAKEHTCDPVPLLIYGHGFRSDGIASFDEISSAKGSLSGLEGRSLLPLLMGYADRSPKYGA
ncbi:MAG: 2,3-bisphosphoglycerate-independent phosphoglycerate mutase [Methanomassiliicoccales archaeon]